MPFPHLQINQIRHREVPLQLLSTLTYRIVSKSSAVVVFVEYQDP